LKLSDKRETFTATVTFDTLDLYGKVAAPVKIVIVAE
jgi:hypothetical protein